MGGEVGTGKVDERLALVGDRVGREDRVDLVVLEDRLTGVRGDLREVELGGIPEDVGGQELVEASVKAAERVVGLVEIAEELGRARGADAKGAGGLDLGCPLGRGDDGGVGSLPGLDDGIEGVLVDGTLGGAGARAGRR